nr:MAG TPA: hypothetical protein [Crassvirales sp.]
MGIYLKNCILKLLNVTINKFYLSSYNSIYINSD